ncbi:MAG: hypothetical protein QM323_05655, partial [Acidobacteriota bacterium]|nr:hypothetical protein [Acidobacteriota bacterium]
DPNPFFRVPGDGAAAEFVQDPAPAQAPAPAPAPPVATAPVTAPNVIEEQASVSAAAAGSVDGNPPFVLTDEGMDPDPVVYRTGRVIQDDPNSYFGVLRDRRKREEEKWAASMRLAVQSQPDLQAEAERLAKLAGVPVDTALGNMDELRQLAQFQHARDVLVESTNPTLYRSFRNFDFQKKAIDDLAALSLGERWTKGIGKGQLLVERGRIATRLRDGNPQPGDQDRLAWIEGEFEQGGHEGVVEWVAEVFGQMGETLPRAIESGAKAGMTAGAAALVAGQMGPQALAPEEAFTVPAMAAAGFFAGFTAEAFVQAYVVEGGNSYQEMLGRKIEEKDARRWSRLVGLANGLIEVGTVGLMAKPWVATAKRKLGMEVSSLLAKPSKMPPFLGEYFRQAGIQTGQEMGQEMVGVVGEWAAAQTGQAPTWGEAWDRVIGVAQKTIASQAVLGLLPAGLHARNQAKAAKRALAVRSYVEGMSGVSVDSKLRDRDPAAFEEHHRKLIEDNPDAPSHFYVNARDLGEVLRQKDRAAVEAGAPLEKSAADQIDGIVPGFAAELEQAEAARGDVVIPAEVYLARIAPLPELNGAVAPLLRDDPDGVPLGKAEQILKQAQEEMRQAEADEEVATAVERARLDGMDEKAAMASAGVKGEKAQGEFLKRRGEQRFEASRREVETEIFKSFNKAAEPMAGARTSRRERASAAFYASHLVASLAARAKVTPQEFWKANTLEMGEMVDEMVGSKAVDNPFARDPEWQEANPESEAYAEDRARLPLGWDLVGYIGEAGDAVGRGPTGEIRRFSVQEQKDLAEKRKDRAFRDEERKYAVDHLGWSGVLKQFAGARALNADLEAARTAHRRLMAGEDAEAVRLETGWHRGDDGMLRYEISDDAAQMKWGKASEAQTIDAAFDRAFAGRDFVELGDLIEHEELFKAYPKLRRYRVMVDAKKGGASFMPNAQTITLGGAA